MRHLVSALLAVLVAFALVACPKTNPPPEPPHDVVVADALPLDDAGDPELDAAVFPTCVLACRRLASLGCPEANPTPNGLSCYYVCAKAEASGKFTLHPDCVANAASQDTLRTQCNVRCQ